MAPRGALIVLEGAEGVGKSTQLRFLAERLQGAGLPPVTVREPGGTPLGDAIRALLLEPGWIVDARTEALLFMASRAQLVRDVVQPALALGRTVLADRFFLSTYAYQVGGQGLAEIEIRTANRLATGGLIPDLTLLLDLPAVTGLERAAARGEQDRMEQLGVDFHRRVGAAFAAFTSAAWQAEHPECGPIVRVDASGTPAQVAARVAEAVAARLPQTLVGLAGSHA